MDNFILNQCEDDWRKNQKKPGPSQLMDIFPEAAPFIKKRLKELKTFYAKEEADRKQRVQAALEKLYSLGPVKDEEFQVWFLWEWIYFFHLKPIEAVIKPFENYARIIAWRGKPKPKGEITDREVERAKEFPLTNLVSPNRAGFILCPFHEERTPSCKIYPHNKWWCFGCSLGGDVIDFVMHQENIDFISAVRKLM